MNKQVTVDQIKTTISALAMMLEFKNIGNYIKENQQLQEKVYAQNKRFDEGDLGF